MLDMKGLLNIASAFLGCGLILAIAMLVLARSSQIRRTTLANDFLGGKNNDTYF